MGKNKKNRGRRGPRQKHKGKEATKDNMNDEEQGVNSETRRNDRGVRAWIRWLFLFEWLRRRDSRVVPSESVLSSTEQLDTFELRPIPDKSGTSSTIDTSNECENEKVQSKYNKDVNGLHTKIDTLEEANQIHLRREQEFLVQIKEFQETAIKDKEMIKKLKRANDQLKDQEKRHREEIGKCNDSMKNKDLHLNERNVKIAKLENDVSMQTHTISNREQKIKSLQKRIKMLENEEEQRVNIINNKDRLINSLKDEKQTLEEEKQDALRRLSAMMSVKLRDNNPNIADLSDQFRPTKLGEQFSELYDNEWTDAFDALQNKFEERHAISILLDIVMESYQFCDQELLEVWTIAENWFIDKGATTAQQISKTLKDGRKQKVLGRVEDIQQKYTGYLLKLCSTEHLDKLMTVDPLRNYISTCVRLALLMTANDPPVVIECPGWQRFSERQYPRATVPHSSADDGLNPEELNPDNRKKNTSITMHETIPTDTNMNGHEQGKVDNIFSNKIKHNADNTDCLFSTSDGMNPISHHSVVNKSQTNGSPLLYIEDNVEGKINPADNSEEHCKESNNLTKMEPPLDAPTDEKFEPTDGAPDTHSNKTDDTDKLHDIPTDDVRNDIPRQTNDDKDGLVEGMSVAESGQRHDADRYTGSPHESQNSDAKLIEKGDSIKDHRIDEPNEKEKNVGSNNNNNVDTDSAQSQLVDHPTENDPNGDAPTDVDFNIDGLCQQIKTMSIQMQEEHEIDNGAEGDIGKDQMNDTNHGTAEGISNIKSGQHYDTDGHIGGPPKPLNSDIKLTEKGDRLKVKRIKESEQTENKIMATNKMDSTKCYVVTESTQTREAFSPTNIYPNRESTTDEKFIIKLQDIPVRSTCIAESGESHTVVEDKVNDKTNDAHESNTKEESSEDPSDEMSGQQQCEERYIVHPTNGAHISDRTDRPPEEMSDTVHESCQHQGANGNIYDSPAPLIFYSQSTTTELGFNENHMEKSQQNYNDVNHNCSPAATEDSHDGPTEKRGKVERPIFDKDKLKEYTSRGPYVEYFVWPIMYLHRDGPMLGKGIAQGSKVKIDDGSNTLHVSWKKMS